MPPEIARHAATALCTLAASCLQTARAAPPGIIDLQGRGVQIYECGATAAGFAWRLKAPDATLLDGAGHAAGHHSGGPSWQAADGSVVVGEVLASGATDVGSVPWLLLRAKSHAGSGAFSSVAYIVRSHTSGGAAPAAGCDTSHAGQDLSVPYSAEYSFFRMRPDRP